MTTERRRKLPYLEGVRTQRHVCFAEQVRAANRAINKFYSDRLAGADVGIAQLSILIRLYYYAQGTTMSRLARSLETDRTTLTRNLQLLERAGHVAIGQGEDRRKRLIELTDRGYAALKATLPLWQRAQRDLLRLLGDERWKDLLQGMRVLATLDDDEPEDEP